MTYDISKRPQSKVRGDTSLARGLRVLLAFHNASERTVSDIAAELEMPVSTVYRFLRELRRFGLVMELADGEYTVGSSLVELALGTWFYTFLRERIEPTLHRLVLRSGETAMAVVRKGVEAQTISQVESPNAIRLSFRVGEVRPLTAGASATALLAFQSSALIEAVIERARTEERTLDESGLRARLDAIRESGYAVSMGEVDPEVVAVASPVFYSSEIVAAISIAGPRHRFEDRLDDLVALVVEEALAVSGSIGDGRPSLESSKSSDVRSGL